MKWLIGILFMCVIALSIQLYYANKEIASVKDTCDYYYRVQERLRLDDRTTDHYWQKAEIYGILYEVTNKFGYTYEAKYCDWMCEVYQDKAEKAGVHPLEPSPSLLKR